MHKKHTLFGVLDWGLGHASRSRVLLQILQEQNYRLTIASSGQALAYLQTHFPEADFLALSNYSISYAVKAKNWKWNLLSQSQDLYKQHLADQQILQAYLKKNQVDILISDNRPSVYSPELPSVYITHQLQLPKGTGSRLGTFIHQRYYSKFDQIWVPDTQQPTKIAGELTEVKKWRDKIHFIGMLSTYEKTHEIKKFDFTSILSGPEPQRTLLEQKLAELFSKIDGKHTIVRGTNQGKLIHAPKNTSIINLASANEIQQILNSSKLVICRSGYSSIMDLISAQQKALLIPTPGQPEQEYLATYFSSMGYFSSCSQNEISLSRIYEAFKSNQTIPQAENVDSNQIKTLLARFF